MATSKTVRRLAHCLAASLALMLSFSGVSVALASNKVALSVDSSDGFAASSVSLEPRSGPVGTRVVIGGTGFSANATLAVKFDGNPILAFSGVTGVTGNFSATFIVPAAPSGEHVVEASDGTNVGSQSFIVTPLATMTPQSGYASLKVSVMGSGFMSKGTATVYFDNEIVQKSAVTDDGGFSVVFNAPPKIAGTYPVKITDGTNTRELAFNVTTSASVSPVTSPDSPGFVGQHVTVGGIGFVPDKDLMVSYDGNNVGGGKVGPDSNFSVTFSVPISRGGLHTVTVSDGTNVIPLKFYMDSTPPPPPSLMAPAVGTTQDANTTFKWSPVKDPSGVTYEIQVGTDPNFDQSSILINESGLGSTEYKLQPGQSLKPAKRTAPYFWRVEAEDGASNAGTWSDTSYFTVGERTPSWVPWMFFGLGAVIIVLFGFWLGRRSSKPAAGSPVNTAKK